MFIDVVLTAGVVTPSFLQETKRKRQMTLKNLYILEYIIKS